MFRSLPLVARVLRLLALALLGMPVALFAQTVTGVGFHAISMRDPVGGGSMPGYVFYPATQATGSTRLGAYEVAATVDAPAVPGAKPLVVISHGHGGSAVGHHDLAVYLARHGFVVATLEHPKDNFHDISGFGQASTLIGRPVQVSATISMLLGDAHWKTLIDPSRIGVAGFSAGGYTSLLLAGAIPSFHLFNDYCQRHPHDPEICGDEIKRMLAAHKDAAGGNVAPTQALQNDLKRWGNTADPRVKAVFSMAPLSLVFDAAGAGAIDRPVFLYYGEHDHVLIPTENAEHIRPWIKTLAGVKVVPKADHWVFLSPCPAELAKQAHDICTDPADVNRTEVHAQINADALVFFRKTLAVPAD